jgi:CspA family cold shock protein
MCINAFFTSDGGHREVRWPYRGVVPRKMDAMPEGTIKTKTNKGFGFITTGTGEDMFFHRSSVEGVSFDELKEGQRVSYTVGQGPKGPRAENVKVIKIT